MTGPIEAVIVSRIECVAVADVARREDWRGRQQCRVVDATGERAHGFVAVTRRADDSLAVVPLDR